MALFVQVEPTGGVRPTGVLDNLALSDPETIR